MWIKMERGRRNTFNIQCLFYSDGCVSDINLVGFSFHIIVCEGCDMTRALEDRSSLEARHIVRGIITSNMFTNVFQ